jgi:sugar lactone lactonase YvrE
VYCKPILKGFALLESPLADGEDVWFSDMAIGGIWRVRPGGFIGTWLPARKMIGGIAINADGGLVCSGTGGIVWVDPVTGLTGTLLDTIEGKPVNGINDMVADGRGGLYFGTVDHNSMFRGEGYLGHSALYRLDADGAVVKLYDGLKFSNGIGLSPDGRTLYFNDSSVGTFACDILHDGALGPRRLLSARADCDGLAVDCEGAVWIAQIGGGMLTRVMPSGKIDRTIPLDVGPITSLCFGGADGRDMFITTAAMGAGEAVMKRSVPERRTAALYHGRADVPGLPTRRTNFCLTRTRVLGDRA